MLNKFRVVGLAGAALLCALIPASVAGHVLPLVSLPDSGPVPALVAGPPTPQMRPGPGVPEPPRTPPTIPEPPRLPGAPEPTPVDAHHPVTG